MLELLAVCLLATPTPQSFSAPTHEVALSDLRAITATQGYGELQFDRGLQGTPLRVAGRRFARGLGTHAPSLMVFALGKRCVRFQAWVGVDAEVAKYRSTPEWKGGKHPSVDFKVLGDGRLLFESGLMEVDTPAKRVDVSLRGVSRLSLVVGDAGDGNYGDWSDWCDPVLIESGAATAPARHASVAYTVRSPGLTVRLSRSGDIVSMSFGRHGHSKPVFGTTWAPGPAPVGPVKVARLPGGAIRFTRRGAGAGHAGFASSTFAPRGSGIRWTYETSSSGRPWSSPIVTRLVWPDSDRGKVWAAWGNRYEWSDPLDPKPFGRMDLDYGAFFSRAGGVSLPLVTVMDSHVGLSLIQSPTNPLIQMQIQVDRDGTVSLVRTGQRLGERRKWRFDVDLVAHEPDPRSALAAIVSRYPKLFDPPSPQADRVGGGGAYSGDESNPDVARLRRMGFTFNWKASIDFPYMGMFLPPLGPTERWNRFAGGGGGGYGPGDEGRFGQTSIAQLEDYSKRMRLAGFHVLSYFNVTEFGGNIAWPAPPRTTSDPTQLWKNPNDFLYTSFPEAILRTPKEPIGTWGGAVILDCGSPRYRDFLVGQARRHIEELPASSGICIDRMDWLAMFNPHADDGISWMGGPVRSLCSSWKALMARIGPMMHKADKVIFVNAMLRRLELMAEVDGVYDEHGDYGYNLNTSSFLCLRKPLVCWTRDEAQVKPDPDGFMQRFLYMGAFVTVPLPGNDHTILPSKFVDKLYFDYGPLFRALHARKWVLSPRVVSTSVGKANVFRTPAGYVVPVVFGGRATHAIVKVRGLGDPGETTVARVIHPGDGAWKLLNANRKGAVVTVDVPLVRGCAMVQLTRAE